MAARHRPLLYLETSLFGFYFDEEPRNASRREAVVTLFDQVRLGILEAATSSRTVLELNRAAEPLRSRLMSLLADVSLLDADDAEAERLAASICVRASCRRRKSRMLVTSHMQPSAAPTFLCR